MKYERERHEEEGEYVKEMCSAMLHTVAKGFFAEIANQRSVTSAVRGPYMCTVYSRLLMA